VTLSEVGTIRSRVKTQAEARPKAGEIVVTPAPAVPMGSRVMSRDQNSGWTMRREILVTWLIAAAVIAVLLLLPAQQSQSLDQALSHISPAAAGAHASQDSDDVNPSSCLERDYVNERC
jgi:hypothetical protein